MFPINRGLYDHVFITIPYSKIEFDIPKCQNWLNYNPFESCAYHKKCMPFGKAISNNKLDEYDNTIIILKDCHWMSVYIKCPICHEYYDEFNMCAYERNIKLYDNRLEIDIYPVIGHFIIKLLI